jgi:AcrR family transcriptional regulator
VTRRERGIGAPDTLADIREAGLSLIYTLGYEGMGLRQLAAEAGVGLSSLYNHFPTKQDLLLGLITTHMEELFTACDAAVGEDGSGLERLVRFVRFHVRHHARRKREVFICYSELRSLTPENYREVAAQRRDYEELLISILDQAVAEGSARATDTRVAAYALLAMLSGICTWFHEGGRLGEEEVTRVYMQLVLAGVVHPSGLVDAIASPDRQAAAPSIRARRRPAAAKPLPLTQAAAND